MSTNLVLFLQQYLIVLAQRRAKDNRRDRFETMNPFPPLRSLPADIKHMYPSNGENALTGTKAQRRNQILTIDYPY